MNAVVTPDQSLATAPRLYAGQGQANAQVSAYTVLLPTDSELDAAIVARAMVADILQRNGRVVDEDTLNAMVDYGRTTLTGADGTPALVDPAWKLQAGIDKADGRPGTPFLGYALSVDAAQQQALLDHADQWVAERDAKGPQPVDDLITELRKLADAAGQQDVVKTLDAVQQGLEAGRTAEADGAPLGEAALRGVLQFASGMGKEREAAKILERYTAIKSVAKDAKDLGQNAERVFNGRDPATGKALDTDARVESAFDMLNGGFKLAGSVGSTALLFGARATGWAGALVGIAPAGMAIVAFAAGAFELIKRAREALLAPRWDEFRERFPFSEDMQPKKAITKALRLVEGMPDGPENAANTVGRITALFGQNPETRDRFFAFLRQKGQHDDLVDALASGRLKDLDPVQAAQLAKLAKQSSKEFLDLEMQDVKRYVRDRDGERERGAYLLPESQRREPYTPQRLQGDLQEAARVAGLLTSSANALNGLYKDMLERIKDNPGLKTLDAQQQKNLAAATVATMRENGLDRADQLVTSKDGTRLFAIQGDAQSDHRRIGSLDIASASRQPIETSSRQATGGGEAAINLPQASQQQTPREF